MDSILIGIFIIGYVAITLEHNIKIDKLIPALAMMGVLWALIALGLDGITTWFDAANTSLVADYMNFNLEEKQHLLHETLLHHLGKTSEILFFLLGAMTIVEIIDYFDGFSTIKTYVKTNKKSKLLWILAIISFFLSAIIDNLTATIVLITITQKIIRDKDSRLWYAGFIVIAANSGGAWSPIGDVTTTMLWIGKKVTTMKLVEYLILPSLVSCFVPVFIASFLKPFKGTFEVDKEDNNNKNKNSALMLYLGIGMIIFVPIFKTITHLPPYVGMMISLAVMATFAEILSRRQFVISTLDTNQDRSQGFHSPVHSSLSKIEMPSVLFFFGILMAVAALESIGLLFVGAGHLNEMIPNTDLVVYLLGVFSAVIDNVPLVAASMGMFLEPMDDHIWHLIAYCAGTGGSILIIGSAAGVVAMGLEKIKFFWYFSKISILALVGYTLGFFTYFIF